MSDEFRVMSKYIKNITTNYELRTTNQRGFSLVEILLIVLVVGFIALLLLNIPSSIRLTGTSKNYSLAKEIASKRMEELRSMGYQSLANGTSNFSDSRLTKMSSATATVIIEDCPVDICPNNEPIKKVKVTINWKETNIPRSIEMNTLIADGGLK